MSTERNRFVRIWKTGQGMSLPKETVILKRQTYPTQPSDLASDWRLEDEEESRSTGSDLGN